MPEGEWALVVDANGDEVRDRTPAATDFLARRPAVQLKDMGGETHPPYAYDRRKNRDENGVAYINHAIRSLRNRDHLEKAIFLLSQTDDGIRLLQMARREKFTIVFDPELCAEEGALGLCDYTNKKIPLAEGRNAAEVALTLKHELQHMEDFMNGVNYSERSKPRNAVFAERALESNARTSEAVAAAQALLGSPHGPERQFRTDALFNSLFKSKPQMAASAHAALSDAKDGRWHDFAAKVFPAYFQETAILAVYDKRYIKFLSKQAPDVMDSVAAIADKEGFYRLPYEHQKIHRQRVAFFEDRAPSLFTGDGMAPEETLRRISIGGYAYAPQLLAAKFDPNADAYVATTPGGKDAYDALRERLEKILPDAGLHQQLDLPVMKNSPRAAPAASPYRGTISDGSEAAFQPIVPPRRIDGHKNSSTDVRRSNAIHTDSLLASYQKMEGGANNDLTRWNFATSEFFYNNEGFRNGHGRGTALLGTGFLGPIAAFRDDYVESLYARVVIAAENNAPVENNLAPEEIRLFAHWQRMRDEGMDPVWIDAETKKDSWVLKDRFANEYSNALAMLVTTTPAKPASIMGLQTAARPGVGMPA